MIINFRPHHFLCALCFSGSGYSPAFINNFESTMNALNQTEADTPITVTRQTDTICTPCPHRRESHCTSEEKVQKLDSAHAAVLKLTDGEALTWQEAKARIKANMSLVRFHQACEGCEWKASGICEQALTAFLSTS